MYQENQNQEIHLEGPNVAPNKSKFSFWSGISVALSMVAAQIIVGLVVALILFATIGIESNRLMSLTIGATLILSFPLAVWIVLRKRNLEATAWTWNNNLLVLLPISFVMVYAMSYIAGTLIEMMPNYEQMLEQYIETFSGIDPILLILGGGIIGPICEEIIFRGIILKNFLKSYDYKLAILFSALIFGLIHLAPLQMISAFLIGLVLGYIYYKTRTLWLVVIIHIVNNMISFIVGTDSISADETTRMWFDNDMLYFGSMILAAGIIYGCYILIERLYLKKYKPSI